MNRHPLTTLCLVCTATIALAQERPQGANDNWLIISQPVIQQLEKDGKKIDWPGVTAGVTADPATGDVYMIVPGQGIWKSADQGQTFTRADQSEIGGRCETGYSLNIDPAGRRLACFMLDGKCAMTLDAGKTWQTFADVGRNWDFAAVDWSQPLPRAIFAARHESGGEMYLSTDAGKTWKIIAKDPKFAAVAIFDDKTLLTTKGTGVLRSTDAGQTWNQVSQFTPIGRVMSVFKGTAYWLAKEGIIISRDRGATWQVLGSPVEAAWGPMFGKDENHLVVAGKKGILQTTDAGKTWKLAANLPNVKGFEPTNPGWFLNLAWDPNADVFYASRMGSHTYKYAPPAPK